MTDGSVNSAKAGTKQEEAETSNSKVKIDKNRIHEAFVQTSAFNCLECGKCTGICPVSLMDIEFSPRIIVKKALLEFEDDLCKDPNLWECLTCGLCIERCRSDVNLPEFIRRLRQESKNIGNRFLCSHNNVLQLIPKLQLDTGDSQKRLEWVTPDIKYHSGGDTLFFVGCAPFHQILFADHGRDNISLPLASLKLLNSVGIEPVLLENERCCGHDQYWTGEDETFKKLVKANIESFKKAGVKRIITACPEGHYMFSQVYPLYSDDYNFEAVHITELMAKKIEEGELKIPERKDGTEMELVSYHDSCKLGRYSRIYEPPRKIIKSLPGIELRELRRNKGSSSCCGVSGFINCDMYSKRWREGKLKEASETGASTLLTGCPKCAIHLNCYLVNEHIEPKFDIKVESVIVKLAEILNLFDNIDDKKVS